MSTKWTIAAIAGAAIISACAGAAVSALYYRAEISSMRLDAATARANQGREDYAKLVAAQDALSTAERERVRLDRELGRVRNAYARSRAGASNASGGDDSSAVSRCEKLLREGAELVAEGGELLQRNAARHDALATVK